MKHGLTYTIGLIALATAGLTSGPAGAVNANGPYYATPSWNQKLPASTRFVILANWNSEAVLDRETGLVWEGVPSTSLFTWFGASFRCLTLNTGGRTGWHLPTIQELLSVVDRSQGSPSLPAGHPFTVQSSGYWSATANASNTAVARSVSFLDGGVGSFDKSTFGFHAWCVRGGQGVDAQ
jgi:hypothetical protein